MRNSDQITIGKTHPTLPSCGHESDFFSENAPDALKSGSVKLCAGISSTKFRTLGSFFILSLSDFISFNRINHFESKIIFEAPNCYENIIFYSIKLNGLQAEMMVIG